MSIKIKPRLSRRILRMEESATIKMASKARELKAQGIDIIDLSLGEPDFDTPDFIKIAASDALDKGYTKYTPVSGLVELRKAIQQKFKQDNDLQFELDEIVVSNGAKQSIANVCLSLLDEGDEVIIFSPYWVSYSEIVKLSEATPVLLKADISQDFKVTAAQLAAAITPQTRMVLFSSPCNPTGSVFNYEELKAIADVVAQHDDIVIVSDEIYEYINFTGKHVSIGAFENVRDRTVTINGFSKGFSMTGWRLGYLGAPKWIAKACDKMQGQFTSGAASFSQMAAAFALNSERTETEMMRHAFEQRKNAVVEGMKKIPNFKVNNPQGAFYLFPDISGYFGKSDGEITIQNADDFAFFILAKAHVAIVTGSAFGDDNCVRLSFAASEEKLKLAVERIKQAVSQLV